jgi:hypothetical protein
MKRNFKKHQESKNLGTPYDFGSVMHYSPRLFAKKNTAGEKESPDNYFWEDLFSFYV